MANEKKDYAQIMAENVIAALEKGTAPWQRPWEPGEAPNTAMNPSTGNAYKGWNRVWLSAAAPDNDPRWLTYKQAEKMGAQVREGEKATPIFIWKTHGTKLLTDDKNKPILDAEGKKQYKIVPYERPYRNTAFVFHASQIDGLPELEKKEPNPEWQRHSEAERILAASQAPIFHDQATRAYYTPTRDQIHLPQREQFPTPDAYYATALHEFGHSTGHSSRLDRDLDHPFGSAGYAIEELRAEMFSLMLGQEIGIGHDPEQHHAYIGSWIKALKEDPEELFRAARDAQSMMDYTHERVKEHEQEQASERAYAEEQEQQQALSIENLPPLANWNEFPAGYTIATAVPTLDEERDMRGQALAAESEAIQANSVSAIGDATAAWATYQQLQSTAEAQGLTTQLLPSNDNDGMYTLHYLDGERVTAIETEIRLPDGAALTTYDGEPITTPEFTTDPAIQQQALNAALSQNQERHAPTSEVQPLSQQALRAEIAEASETANEGYNAQESLENLESVAAANGMTVQLSAGKGEYDGTTVSYLKDGKPTGVTTELLPGDGKAVTSFNGERIQGTGYTSDLEWQQAALQAGITAFQHSQIRQEVSQLIADNEAYSPELAEKDGEWQLMVGGETFTTYQDETEATQALSYVNNVGAAIALEMLHAERIPEGMDAATIIAAGREPNDIFISIAVEKQAGIYHEAAQRLEAAQDNSSDKAIIAEVIQKLEAAGFTQDGEAPLYASHVKDGIAVTPDNGATRQESSVFLLSQKNPDVGWKVNVGRSTEFGDHSAAQYTAEALWQQINAEIQRLSNPLDQALAEQEEDITAREQQTSTPQEKILEYLHTDHGWSKPENGVVSKNLGSAAQGGELNPDGDKLVHITLDDRNRYLILQSGMNDVLDLDIRDGHGRDPAQPAFYHEDYDTDEGAKRVAVFFNEKVQEWNAQQSKEPPSHPSVVPNLSPLEAFVVTEINKEIAGVSKQAQAGAVWMDQAETASSNHAIAELLKGHPDYGTPDFNQQMETVSNQAIRMAVIGKPEIPAWKEEMLAGEIVVGTTAIDAQLTAMGYNLDELDKDNPYNQWMQDTQDGSSTEEKDSHSFEVKNLSPLEAQDTTDTTQLPKLKTYIDSKNHSTEQAASALVEYLDLPEADQEGFDYISGDNYFVPRFTKDEEGVWQDTMPPTREMHFLPMPGQNLPFGKTDIQSVTESATSEQAPLLQPSRRYGEQDIDLFADGLKVGTFFAEEKDFQHAQLQQWQTAIAKHLPDTAQAVVSEIITKAEQEPVLYQQVELYQRTGYVDYIFAIGETLTAPAGLEKSPEMLDAIGDISHAQSWKVTEELPYLNPNNIQPPKLDIEKLTDIQAIGKAFDTIGAKRKEIDDLHPANWQEQQAELDKQTQALGKKLDSLYPEPNREDPAIAQKGKDYRAALANDQHPLRTVKSLTAGDRINTPKKPGVAGVIGGVVEAVKPQSVTVIDTTAYGMKRHKISKQALKGGTLYRNGEFYGLSDKDREKATPTQESTIAEPNHVASAVDRVSERLTSSHGKNLLAEMVQKANEDETFKGKFEDWLEKGSTLKLQSLVYEDMGKPTDLVTHNGIAAIDSAHLHAKDKDREKAPDKSLNADPMYAAQKEHYQGKEGLEKRNIWIPDMRPNKLDALLATPTKTANDIEDLKDFKYFLLTDLQSAVDKGFYQEIQADQKEPAFALKNKFWLTNIDAALEDAEKQSSPSVATPSTTEQAVIQSRADDLAATKPQGASQEAEDLQRKAETLKDKQSSEAAQHKDNPKPQERPDTPPNQENASSFVVTNQPHPAQEKTFLAIPFADKDKAKKAAGQLSQGGPALGWDSTAKSWYANVGADLNKLKQWLPENVKDRQERPDPPEVEFAKALKDAGLELPGAPIMDGAKHRVPALGDKAGQKSGEYVGYTDGHPAGFIRNFRDESKTGSWKYTGNKVDEESVQDWKAINADREAQKAQKRAATQETAASTTATAWENLRPTPHPEHPYLVAKGLQGTFEQVQKFGVRQDDNGNLVVPARDKEGKLWNMQRIGGTGWKGFEKDAKLQGCFHVIGGRKALKEQGNAEPVIISTGFGTAATIHLATGKPVIVAFNDNNMKAVAEEFKKIFPERTQAIFGDDDQHLPLLPRPLANSGREKATEAAEAVGGIAVFPRFASGTAPTKEFSDFNDLQRQQGMKAVQRQVEQGLAQARSTVTTQKALEQAQAKDKPEKNRAGGMEIAR